MTKELNTRIRLKYDTLADWTTNKSVVLLEGEIGLCYVPAITTGTTTTAPTVLFKVGDGVKTWEKLPWGAGLAADVPSWAKAASAPADSNTTYQIVPDGTDKHKFTLQSQEKGSTDWATVSTITIPDNNQTIKVGDVVFGASDAITLVGDSGVTVLGDKANKKITFKVEKAAEATKADSATTAEKVAKALKFGAKSYDGSTEQTITAADINKDLTLQINGTTKVAYNGSAAGTFNITTSDLGLSGAMHFLGISTTEITNLGTQKPTIDSKAVNPAIGDVVLYNHLEFVWDGSKWEKLGDESSYALKDHIPVAAAAAPANLGTAAVGTSAKYAREDHVHKMPSLDEIAVNTKANYVVFYCGTSSDLI